MSLRYSGVQLHNRLMFDLQNKTIYMLWVTSVLKRKRHLSSAVQKDIIRIFQLQSIPLNQRTFIQQHWEKKRKRGKHIFPNIFRQWINRHAPFKSLAYGGCALIRMWLAGPMREEAGQVVNGGTGLSRLGLRLGSGVGLQGTQQRGLPPFSSQSVP